MTDQIIDDFKLVGLNNHHDSLNNNACAGIIALHVDNWIQFKHSANWKTNVSVIVVKNNNKWGVPKGHSYNKESYIACALREFNEETGIELSKNSLVKFKNSGYYRLSIYSKYYFVAFITSDMFKHSILQPIDSTEISECKWMTIDEIEKLQDDNINVTIRIIRSSKNKNYIYNICTDCIPLYYNIK
jgi:ADP-ribose pyrophosphatase YjhB (NUDIX family)